MSERKLEWWQLGQRQSLPLDLKVRMTLRRIREWYEAHDGAVYVSFSGGKDSTALLHLVRSLYPEVPGCFADTGLEYPEIRAFVRSVPNVEWVRPEMPFRRVVEVHGWPVVSKKTADYIHRVQVSDPSSPVVEKLMNGRLRNGRKSQFSIPAKWHHLCRRPPPFRISAACCRVLKEKPLGLYGSSTGRVPYVGTMAGDSRGRKEMYLKFGCNVFDGKPPMSRPLAFWTTDDVWAYLRGNGVPYSSIYEEKGIHGTGCFACCFGAHMEPRPNRFERMRGTHPKLWRYCFDFLGMGRVLDELGVAY